MLDLNGLLGRVLNAGGQILDTPGKKLAAGGVGAALLFTETGRDIAGAALKYGGIAVLGGLAYHAWQKHRAQQEGQRASPAPDSPRSLPPGYVPTAPAAQESLARLIVSAMVTAAKADGTLDADEQGKILGHAEQLKLSEEEQSFLYAEFGKPFDMEPVVKAARTPEIAAEVYAASLLAVGQPSPAEVHYLKRLAQRLQLPEGVVSEIHRSLGIQSVPA
jgi:uncharacterized membrane protein YebE (DUF533 family)